MKKSIKNFVDACDTYENHKVETIEALSLLEPLPLRETPWAYISMDFIIGLPNSFDNFVTLVMVDKPTTYAHFCALAHPYIATGLAQLFMEHIFKLHGMPQSIINDQDPTFTNKFWQELFKFQGIKLKLGSTDHPQIDGQIEAINKCLQTLLTFLHLSNNLNGVVDFL